jgi:hypothetical protein
MPRLTINTESSLWPVTFLHTLLALTRLYNLLLLSAFLSDQTQDVLDGLIRELRIHDNAERDTPTRPPNPRDELLFNF